MTARAEEHRQWNLDHTILRENAHIVLYCPVCADVHHETLTNDPSQPDYYHHVHQCTACEARFDVFVRTRSKE